VRRQDRPGNAVQQSWRRDQFGSSIYGDRNSTTPCVITRFVKAGVERQ
jgi:hypothetical protein